MMSLCLHLYKLLTQEAKIVQQVQIKSNNQQQTILTKWQAKIHLLKLTVPQLRMKNLKIKRKKTPSKRSSKASQTTLRSLKNNNNNISRWNWKKIRQVQNKFNLMKMVRVILTQKKKTMNQKSRNSISAMLIFVQDKL